MASLCEPEEQPSCRLWVGLLPVVSLVELLRDPGTALTDSLKQFYRNLAIPHSSNPIQVHHCERVGCRGMSTVQGLCIPESSLLERLIHARASQVQRSQVEHAV